MLKSISVTVYSDSLIRLVDISVEFSYGLHIFIFLFFEYVLLTKLLQDLAASETRVSYLRRVA